MKKLLLLLFITFLFACSGKEYHVSTSGDDNNSGSEKSPFKTIQQAANIAQPGDVIIVHEGIYRERIDPPRGGLSDNKRIIYQAKQGHHVKISGSEIISNWDSIGNGVWKTIINNSFFGSFNPFNEKIWGDWFFDQGRDHHTADVYINDISLYEAKSLDNVLNPKPIITIRDPQGSILLWYAEVEEYETSIYASFGELDPNKELTEINVREACFYPSQPGINYITVSGFKLSQAATPWAPPTAEQIGLIGTNWGKGWIIEHNEISHSRCVGITIGKERSTGHNVASLDPTKYGHDHYNEVIDRALEIGWNKENVGSHIIRNNRIYNCEQAGIVGSLGCIFSEIYDNEIYDIWVKRLFDGAEIAGIKLHAPIDVLIARNRIFNAGKGIWLDWMTQGTRVTQNICYNNTHDDFFTEVNHGPYVVDNNIFLSKNTFRNCSHGGAFLHNLINGIVINNKDDIRETPYHEPHATAKRGLKSIEGGDDRYYNNIFVQGYEDIENRNDTASNERIGYGLEVINYTISPVFAAGNIYLNGAMPYKNEKNFFIDTSFNPNFQIIEKPDGIYLTGQFPLIEQLHTNLISSELLGNALITNLPFVYFDGSPYLFNHDYFGFLRNDNPSSGPFEPIESNTVSYKIWSK